MGFTSRCRVVCFHHLPPLLTLAVAPFPSRGSCGGTGKAYGWGLHLRALGWRGDIFPKTGLRDPRESAGVGGLGRAHGELGPEEALPLPFPNGPWQHAIFPHPFQPGHGNGCGQKGWAGFREGVGSPRSRRTLGESWSFQVLS